MNELIVSLAAQHVPFQNAYRMVHQYYGIGWLKFAHLWNHAVDLVA